MSSEGDDTPKGSRRPPPLPNRPRSGTQPAPPPLPRKKPAAPPGKSGTKPPPLPVGRPSQDSKTIPKAPRVPSQVGIPVDPSEAPPPHPTHPPAQHPPPIAPPPADSAPQNPPSNPGPPASDPGRASDPDAYRTTYSYTRPPRESAGARALSTMAFDGPSASAPPPAQAAPTDDDQNITLELRARGERLRKDDPVGAARAFVELGIYQERVLGDREAARRSFESARSLQRNLQATLSRIRRLHDIKSERAKALSTIDDELSGAENDERRADLLAERGRHYEAMSCLAEARSSFEEALRIRPELPSAMRGLETVLRQEAGGGAGPQAVALADHLERMADCYAPQKEGPGGDPRLAAWLLVERAQILELTLQKYDTSKSAFTRAVTFEPGPGPVRHAFVAHLLRQGRHDELVSAYSVEAEQETDDARAARLLYIAGRITIDQLRTPTDAVMLLSRASARIPEGAPSHRRILEELIAQLEGTGNLESSAAIRQKRLALLTENEQIVHERVRLSEIFATLGRADQSAHEAARALALDPRDKPTRERLDRALQRLGQHPERRELWLSLAQSDADAEDRVDAFLRAADIAERHLHNKGEALTLLRSAWAIAPGHADTFDALSAMLAPPPRNIEEDRRGVVERLDLYRQSLESTADEERQIALHAKIADIYEDELGQPDRAIEQIDRILELDPKRRSAVIALERCAKRAGDAKNLARALTLEADLTDDDELERRLLLEAARVFSERVGDRARAAALIERALEREPNDRKALALKASVCERSNRFDDARETHLKLAKTSEDPDETFRVWMDIARLDETRRRQPEDAVEAYRAAARVRPNHPLPALEIVRLLRDVSEFDKLTDALIGLAKDAASATDRAKLLQQAAEVQEFVLGDDEAALKNLQKADDAAMEIAPDPAILEAMERIHIRKRRRSTLTQLYALWLERKPPANLDYAIRVALADALEKGDKQQSVAILSGLRQVVPNHVPSLRRLERLHRELDQHGELAAVLRDQAEMFTSTLARAGSLWQLVALEEKIGENATLDALARLANESPRDSTALDSIIRIAGRVVAGGPGQPTAHNAQQQLLAALRFRKGLSRDPFARASYQLEEALIAERQGEYDTTALHAALSGYRETLTLWGESLVAARGLARLADRLGDHKSLILSLRALAAIVDGKQARAGYLSRAARLIEELGEPNAGEHALALYEEGLRLDPENSQAGAALARLLAHDSARLIDRLGEALKAVRQDAQVVLLGKAIARATLAARNLHRAAPGSELSDLPRDIGAIIADQPQTKSDFNTGISAMRRVLKASPEDLEGITILSKLLAAQGVWSEARDSLLKVVDLSPDPKIRIGAHFAMAQMYEGPLSDLERAENSLVAALAIEPQHKHGLERLHEIAVKRDDRALVISVLERLANFETDAATRVAYDLRLADACRDAGDNGGMIRALCDAIVSSPKDLRAWNILAQGFRLDTTDGAAGYAKALLMVLDIATERRLPIEPRWLMTLGLIEVNVLMTPKVGVQHLQKATGLGAPLETRVALGQGYLKAGRNKDAVDTLRDLLTADSETILRLAEPSGYTGIRKATVAPTGTVLAAALATLEAALATEGRPGDRLAVEEVRACLGEVPAERVNALRARRLKQEQPIPEGLAGSELSRLLVPEARSPLIDVAVALAPVAAKSLRFELSSIGVSSRDRIGPRDGNPSRMICERLARCLGIEEFEFYISPTWTGGARVFPGDPPAIVGPANFVELPEPEQIFGLSRLLTRMALGVTWLDELTLEQADALLLAAMRASDPMFGSGEVSQMREDATMGLLPQVQKAIGRRQRRMIEEILPNASAAYDIRSFVIGVRRSEYRTAYVMTGDLVCGVDYLRRFDRELQRVHESPRVLLQHPVTNELLRYAMTEDALNQRSRIGTLWTNV